MPLLTSPKAGSATASTPSRSVARQEVSVSRPSQSTARVQALKDRLSKAPTPSPVAPRPAGSSARAESMAKLTKYQSPAPSKPAPAMPARTAARAATPNFDQLEPQPSGLAPGQSIIQPNTSTELAEPSAEAPSDEQLSPQAASLARKEIQLRKAQQAFKAEQDAWKQEQAKYVSRESLLTDPLKVLAEAGLTSEKLVELQLNQAAPKDPQQVLQEELAQLKKQLQDIIDPENGTLAKRDQDAYNQVIEQIRSDASLVVESNPAYGTIKSEGQAEEVVKLITSAFDEDGTVLDVEEACQLVEDKLVQRLSEQYERLSKYEKIQAKLRKPAENLAEELAEEPAQPSPSQSQRFTTTITNAGATTRQLSPRDKAIQIIEDRLRASRK